MAAKSKSRTAKAAPAAAVDSSESAMGAIGKRIMEIPEQIWQAGLGAFNKAQEQGSKLFETLVQEGSALEAATSKYTSRKVQEVRGAVESTMSTVKDRASDTWDRLEKVFEDRVSRALGALGIPGRRDLEELGEKVAQLQKQIAELKKAGKEEVASAGEQVISAVKAAPAKAAKAVREAPAKAVQAVKDAPAKAAQAVKDAPARARKAVAAAKQVATDVAGKAGEVIKDLTGSKP